MHIDVIFYEFNDKDCVSKIPLSVNSSFLDFVSLDGDCAIVKFKDKLYRCLNLSVIECLCNVKITPSNNRIY